MAGSCEFEFMEYVDEDNIDPNLICSICRKPFKEPVCTSCDHTYGRACITQWLGQDNHSSCPICVKQPLLIKELIQASRPLRNMLEQLRIRCTLCGQTGIQRGNFLDHVNKVCPKAMVQCQASDLKCPWKGTRDELQNHVSTCIFEPLRPVLASLIAENRQLIEQIQKHDIEIKKLTKDMSQLNNIPTHDPNDDESDTSSVSDVDDNNQKEENAIFIRNLPATIKFNDLFDFFSKIGRIKYDTTAQKAEIFIFKNPNRKDGPCSAKVVYTDKDSAAAAIVEYNNKHVSQWNTRILVTISNPPRKNLKDSRKDKNEGSSVLQHAAKAMTGCEKASNKDEIMYYSLGGRPQSPAEPSQATKKKKNRRPQHSHQDDKPTS